MKGIINGKLHEWFESPEREPLDYCAACQCEVFNDDYMFGGRIVCEDCYNKAHDLDTVISFIKAELTVNNDFFKYLHDVLWGAGDCEEGVAKMLEEYRDFKEREFEEWFVG